MSDYLNNLQAKIFAVEKVVGELAQDGGWVYDRLHAAIYSDQDELSTHDEQRAEIEALKEKLRDWDELSQKNCMAPLGETVWPNNWHQDCAAVAFRIHTAEAKAEKLTAALVEARDALARERTAHRLRWNPDIPQWETPHDEAERIIQAALAEPKPADQGAT